MRQPGGHAVPDDHTPGAAVTAMRASAATARGRAGRPLQLPLPPLLQLLPLLLLLLLQLACYCPLAHAAPLSSGGYATPSRMLVDYMQRFGYTNTRTRNLVQLKDTIRTMQRFFGVNETGVEDAATVAAMQRPRCGRPDVERPPYSRAKRHHHGQARHGRDRRHTVMVGYKWPTNNVTWSLERQRLPHGMDHGSVRRDISDAFRVWSSVTNLRFTEVLADGDIDMSFHSRAHHDGFPFDGRGNVLAHAFFPSREKGTNGDVHFDADEVWYMMDQAPRGEDRGTSLYAVAAHEIGHSLGLSHSSVPGALMAPFYQELPRDFQLPEDDMHGIMQIYGSKQGRMWDRVPHYKPNPHAPARPPAPAPPVGPAPAPPRFAPTTPRGTPRYTPGAPRHPDKPDTCNTAYDAVAVIRKEVFFFKGKYLWRITSDKTLVEGYPAQTIAFWSSLPANLTHVDAVYERKDGFIVFFIGKEYFVYNSTILKRRGALTDLGLPPTLTHLDDAMVWGHNGNTYLFSGSMYWKLDEESQRVELDYPRNMAVWRGVGYNIDAVFQWRGDTYFFKGKGFWKFNDGEMRVHNRHPQPSSSFWMGCSEPDGGWFDWEDNAIDIDNDIESSYTYLHTDNGGYGDYGDYGANEDDDDSAAQQMTSTMTVLCLCLSLSSYLTIAQ